METRQFQRDLAFIDALQTLKPSQPSFANVPSAECDKLPEMNC